MAAQVVPIEQLREHRTRRLGPQNDELLSQAQLAHKLGVTDRTIRNWAKRGMPEVPYGYRAKRYRLSEVEAWSRSLS